MSLQIETYGIVSVFELGDMKIKLFFFMQFIMGFFGNYVSNLFQMLHQDHPQCRKGLPVS